MPTHLRDTHYAGAERLGSGRGYRYPHDFPGHYVPQQYLPDELAGREYYHPSDQGGEARIAAARERRKARDAAEGAPNGEKPLGEVN